MFIEMRITNVINEHGHEGQLRNILIFGLHEMCAASVESHTSTLHWLPVCPVQAPGIHPVPQLVMITGIRNRCMTSTGYR